MNVSFWEALSPYLPTYCSRGPGPREKVLVSSTHGRRGVSLATTVASRVIECTLHGINATSTICKYLRSHLLDLLSALYKLFSGK